MRALQAATHTYCECMHKTCLLWLCHREILLPQLHDAKDVMQIALEGNRMLAVSVLGQNQTQESKYKFMSVDNTVSVLPKGSQR